MKVRPKFIEFNNREFLDLGFVVLPSDTIAGFGATPKTLEDGTEVLGIFVNSAGKDYFFNVETVEETIEFLMEMRKAFFSREFNFNVDNSEEDLREYLTNFMASKKGPEDGQV